MDKKKEKQSVLQLLFGFMDRANGDHVGAYAAQAAYFLIMSFIPFILFLTTIIRYTASGSWKSDSDYGRKVRSIPWENYRKDHWSQDGACICRTVSDLSDFV